MPTGIYLRTEKQRRKLRLYRLGTKLSLDHRNKISLGCRGNVAWNKGKELSAETCKRMSLARVGTKLSKETKKKIGRANSVALRGKKLPNVVRQKISQNNARFWLGKKLSEEIKHKIRTAKLGKTPWNKDKKCPQISAYLKGRKHTEETKQRIGLARVGKCMGKNHPRWKGGTYGTERHRVMSTFEYKNWRKAVFTRDNWTCVWCKISGSRKTPIEADHIKAYSLYPELRFDVSNGRTLCKPCHRRTDTWGINRPSSI